MTTPEELYNQDAGFRQLADMWYRLTEWQRWKLFFWVVWFHIRQRPYFAIPILARALFVALQTVFSRMK